MLAPGTQSPSVIDSLNGSMEEWYNAVDASIKKSDVIPGNYEYTINTSYGNVGNIVEGSSTHFDISCDRFKVISLENSYLTLKQHLHITLPPGNDDNDQNNPGDGDYRKITQYYIGYKSAFDAIAQYRIYSNSDHVQTQNHANYEWFMLYNSIPDEVKEKSEIYATYDKINRMDPFVPGTYVKVNSNAPQTVDIVFDVRIPLNSFLMLYNLKYFPDWAGKLTLEVYPSYKNIVICPILGRRETFESKEPSEHTVSGLFADPTNVCGMHLNPINSPDSMNFGFTQINQHVMNNYRIGNNRIHLPVFAMFQATGDECYFNECKIRLATYLLKVEVATSLAAKYAQVPLIFPIQTTQIKDFTSALPNAANTHFTTANTIALKHCGSMFLVFKDGPFARTCFNNPFLRNFRVNVDGKFYPREELATFNDRRFINLTLDALNLNNSSITSIGRDLATSLQPLTKYTVFTARVPRNTHKWVHGDHSNFMIGIPFCDSDDFMGGLSTIGTVQIELSGERDGIDGRLLQYLVTAICFEDCYLKIRSIKPDGRSQIEITNATIEQMSLGGL